MPFRCFLLGLEHRDYGTERFAVSAFPHRTDCELLVDDAYGARIDRGSGHAGRR
jgi:hypothetical protein